jgi:hypothetical protein
MTMKREIMMMMVMMVRMRIMMRMMKMMMMILKHKMELIRIFLMYDNTRINREE